MKIGVFICHCGENIGRTVDCVRVAKACSFFPNVVHSVEYKYMCSDPGQNIIKQAIKDLKLDGVVVGSCSPHMHEKTFRKAVSDAGVNPFLCEIANLREHVSWVHDDKEVATDKAIVHAVAAVVAESGGLKEITNGDAGVAIVPVSMSKI